MSWNEPGGGRQQDPWGGGRGGDQGPPDLDEAFRKLQSQLGGLFGGGGGSGGRGGAGGFGAKAVALVAGVLLALYAVGGFYTLDEQERGVVFRFGAVQNEVMQPGLRWRPLGVDSVVPVNTTRVFVEEHQAQMLTEDQNIVDVSLTVQYRIADPVAYVVNVREPRESLKQATESALRHVVGSSTMDDVIGQGREAMAATVQERLQVYLNVYGTGMSVRSVNLDRGAPPREVEGLIRQKAREDEERFINKPTRTPSRWFRRPAERPANYRASAYRDGGARAEGEASIYCASGQARLGCDRDRLYIDAMERVLGRASVLLDVQGGNQMLYLPSIRLCRAGMPPPRVVCAPPGAVDQLTTPCFGNLSTKQ